MPIFASSCRSSGSATMPSTSGSDEDADRDEPDDQRLAQPQRDDPDRGRQREDDGDLVEGAAEVEHPAWWLRQPSGVGQPLPPVGIVTDGELVADATQRQPEDRGIAAMRPIQSSSEADTYCRPCSL
jgi:hypothetical protein